LLPGTYLVKFTLPGGYAITKTNIGDPATDSNGLDATSAKLASGEQDMTLDLGVYFAVAPTIVPPSSSTSTTTPSSPASPVSFTAPASVPTLSEAAPVAVKGAVTGVVYLDGDRSSKKGSNELGRPGVKVNLLDKRGNQLQTVLTDDSGRFRFNAEPGDYIIEIVPPAELGATSPIRLNVSVLGNEVEGPVVSFGLASPAADLALTGQRSMELLRLGSLMVLVGLGLTNVTRRRRRRQQ
jgi:hypothetical protein